MSSQNIDIPILPPSAGAATLGELQLLLYEYARRVMDFLKLLPVLEYKTITTVGNFPVFVSTRVQNPIEVRRAQTYETKNSAIMIANTSIAWRKSPDPRQPGIYIGDIGGLTGGTDYTIVLAIQGVR